MQHNCGLQWKQNPHIPSAPRVLGAREVGRRSREETGPFPSWNMLCFSCSASLYLTCISVRKYKIQRGICVLEGQTGGPFLNHHTEAWAVHMHACGQGAGRRKWSPGLKQAPNPAVLVCKLWGLQESVFSCQYPVVFPGVKQQRQLVETWP